MAYIFDRETYHRYLNSAAWRRQRELAFAHHGRACQACHTGEELTVHHVTYERFGREDVDDLRVLCAAHHDLVHHLQRAGGHSLRAATALVIDSHRSATDMVHAPMQERPHERPAPVDWRVEAGLLGVVARTEPRAKTPLEIAQRTGTREQKKAARAAALTLQRHRPHRREGTLTCSTCSEPFPCTPWKEASEVVP